MMTRGDFRRLLQEALSLAADNAEAKLKKSIPRSYLIRLHAFGYDDRLVSIDDALDKLYLGGERFFRIIDVAIAEVRSDASVVFVRPSGHEPDAWRTTWDPSSSGPFKQIIFDKILDSGGHGTQN
jgi:hypothetical protein